jgi:hypothetical protein
MKERYENLTHRGEAFAIIGMDMCVFILAKTSSLLFFKT